MPWRSGSPHGVFSAGAGAEMEAAGAWADACVTGTETRAPAAAVAIATASIEPDCRSRMMVSLYLQIGLLQRIGLKLNTLYAVPGSRIRTPSFRKGELFGAPAMQQPREAEVSFDAARRV